MKSAKPIVSFAPYEIRQFIMPVTLSSIAVFAVIILDALATSPLNMILLITFSVFGILYLTFNYISAIKLVVMQKPFGTLNAIVTGVGLGVANTTLPNHLSEITHTLIILGTLAIAATSGRKYAYLALIGIVIFTLPKSLKIIYDTGALLEYITPAFVSISVVEVVSRIQETTQQHIFRLQTINGISRQIMQSLNIDETLSLLDTTIQQALEADTFFIGILEGENINLKLFYDDGQYFNGTIVPMDGTLSGWVIKNQKELYLPDLRENVKMDGVDDFVIGQDKTSLSWIGVPLKTENITGIITLASYTVNAFDRADLELLISLGQHVMLALDNSVRHAKVEKQAQLDSLTGVYNHGYFLKLFDEHALRAQAAYTPLSVIMLDIDNFKRYNDTFGHLVGDRVLNTLCTAISRNIKQTDAVGRWGGEEFIISLPGAGGKEAVRVAKRISETMSTLHIEDRDHRPVPVPTISQGVAVFKLDSDDIFKMIDIADRRLYLAKESGGNQIEPKEEFWNK